MKILLLSLVLLGACSGSIRPETRAALASLSEVVAKGCASGALSAADCDAARVSLERLGLDLAEAQQSAVAAWNSAAPLATRIAEVLFRLIGA